jgi:hypothetical protein
MFLPGIRRYAGFFSHPRLKSMVLQKAGLHVHARADGFMRFAAF